MPDYVNMPGGPRAVAEILNTLEPEQREDILARMQAEAPEMAEAIRELMFVFEDIMRLTDKDVREIIGRVPLADLTLALRGISAMLKDKFFKNMSSRTADMVAEDLEAMAPVRLSEVRDARGRVAAVARELGKQGVVDLNRDPGEVYI